MTLRKIFAPLLNYDFFILWYIGNKLPTMGKTIVMILLALQNIRVSVSHWITVLTWDERNLLNKVYKPASFRWLIIIRYFFSNIDLICCVWNLVTNVIVTRNGKIVWRAEKFIVSWNLPSGRKQRGSILRNMASFEGDQLLAWSFSCYYG